MATGLLLALLLLSCRSREDGSPVDLPAPVQTAQAPRRVDLAAGVRLDAVASYRLEALVMRTERYWWGPLAAVAPLDLALAWGPAAQAGVQRQIRVDQFERMLFWYSDRRLANSRELAHNMANVHVIPASAAVRQELLALGAGDLVVLEGELVNVWLPGQPPLRTSLSRQDNGKGACEILLVHQVRRY